MLEVNKITASYGIVPVLHDVSLSVKGKELVVLVGSNGAGKTTLLKTILGFLKPIKGTIKFLNEKIDILPTYKIVEKGLTLVPEGRQIFPNMTVIENLELGAYTKRARDRVRDSLENVFRLFPRLEERRYQLARTLSGGEQQMLAIARGLMGLPYLLMIDEPSLGLMPILVKKVFESILKLRDEGITILLVEQNAFEALSMADRAYVIENGEITMEGTGTELLMDEYIKKAYLAI